jgi:hypothetical protein
MHVSRDEMDHLEEKLWQNYKDFFKRQIRIWIQYIYSGSGSGSDLAQMFLIRIHNTAKPTALSFLS